MAELLPSRSGRIRLKLCVFEGVHEQLVAGTKVRAALPGKSALYTGEVREHHTDGSMTVYFGSDGVITLPADHDVEIPSEKEITAEVDKAEGMTILELKKQFFGEEIDAKKYVQFVARRRVLPDTLTLDRWPVSQSSSIRVSITDWPRWDPDSLTEQRSAPDAVSVVRKLETEFPLGIWVNRRAGNCVQALKTDLSGGTQVGTGERVMVADVASIGTRLRGRIVALGDPGLELGWLSLINLQNGSTWAEPVPRPLLGDLVEILKTEHTSENVPSLIGTHGVISYDSKSEGLCYQVGDCKIWLGRMDCEVVEAAPEQVISLQVNQAEGDGLSVMCCTMAGMEIVTLNDPQIQTLGDVRRQLEDHMKVADDRLNFVLPDGRLMAKTEGEDLPISVLLMA